MLQIPRMRRYKYYSILSMVSRKIDNGTETIEFGRIGSITGQNNFALSNFLYFSPSIQIQEI